MPEEEERERLAKVIRQWNNNRLDLFEISQPDEVSHPTELINRMISPFVTANTTVLNASVDINTAPTKVHLTVEVMGCYFGVFHLLRF